MKKINLLMMALLLAAFSNACVIDDTCTVQPLPTLSFDTDTLLPPGCYLAKDDVYVSNSATLTLSPGTTLFFAQDTEMQISSDAALNAVGTPDKPIVFTGETKRRGFWTGITFTNSNSDNNRLDYVTVEYAGAGGTGVYHPANIALLSSGYPVRLSMNHSTLRESAGYGFYFRNEAILPEFKNNTVTRNVSGAGFVHSESAWNLDDTTTYRGNDKDVVEVLGNGVDVDNTWPGIDVDYLISDNTLVYAKLTIAAGARLVFKQDASLEIQSDGALNAVGTESNPIVFTGETKRRGFWQGIFFTNSNNDSNRFDYVTIEYAGASDVGITYPSNVSLWSSGYPVRLTMNHSTLRESAGYGFYLRNEAVLPEFKNNTITQNALGAGVVHSESAWNLDDTSTYSGNDKDVVEVLGNGVDVDNTWQAIDADYLVSDSTFIHAKLTIEAGARLVFRQDSGLEIQSDGALTAVGTAEKPIVFTGEERVAGFWNGINFLNANSFGNQLDYATVEYGGAYDFDAGGGAYANISLTSSGYPVRLSLTHSTLRNSSHYGVWLSVEAVLINDSNTFSGNASGDIFQEQN
jgi:hypothetical protein